MKKLLFLILWVFVQPAFSQNRIQFQFKISKPYCVFNFMQAATGHHTTSPTLEELVNEKTKGDQEFAQLCAAFSSIRLDYVYNRDEFPDKRRHSRSTFDLINIALVNSNSYEEVENRIIGILPNGETRKFLEILQKAEVYYDRLIWKENEAKMKGQLEALSAYSDKCSEIFSRIKTFYNSSWSSDVPFVVTLYPIPGREGSTIATPYANSLCIGVLTDETDHIGRMGVVLHEMCHVLYDEQPAGFQHVLDGYFSESKSAYHQFAYNFIDEGLATALGNGWGFETLNGEPDPGDWYNNEYINGFGKALFPLVKEYLSQNKAMDKDFVDRAIDLFGKTFPNSVTDYSILLNRVSIYCNAETMPEINELTDLLGNYFQMTHRYLSAPILDPATQEFLKTSEPTQLVILDRNVEPTIKMLKKFFPELAKVKLQPNQIHCFFDSKKRPVIILYATDTKNLDGLLQAMQSKKYFDQTKVIQD